MTSKTDKTKIAAREREQSADMSRAVHTAYQAIRSAILKGELKAGELLPEKELGEKIGVSRTPIREALNRLRNEGLVVLERYRKNYVANFSSEDVVELMEVRALLEGYLARRAVPRMSEDDLRRLQELAAAMEAIVFNEDGDLKVDYPPLNEEFHRLIADAASCPRTERLLESSFELPFDPPHGRLRHKLRQKLERSCHYHRAIIEAFERHDPAGAELHMRSHLLSLIPYRI